MNEEAAPAPRHLKPTGDAPAAEGAAAAAPAKKVRIEFVDVAKGISIIAIVVAHITMAASNPVLGGLQLFCFQFHVPIFFLVAGYFLSKKRSLGQFVRQKAQRMLLPYVLTCAIIVLGVVLLIAITGQAHPPSLYPRAEHALFAALYGSGWMGSPTLPEGIIQIGALWFLEAIFIGMLIVRVAIIKEKLAPVIVIVLFVLAIWSARYIWLPFNLQSGAGASLYIYIGYLCKKARLLERMPRGWKAALLFVALLAVAAVGVYFRVAVYLVHIDFTAYYLGLPLSLATTYLVLMVARFVSDHTKVIKAICNFFGKDSMVVLCAHAAMLALGISLRGMLGLDPASTAAFFANTGLHLGVAALAIVVVRHVKPLKWIFG